MALILLFDKLQDSPKGLRLDGIVWALESDCSIRLWWLGAEKDGRNQLIMPLEGRGQMDLEKVFSLHSHQGARGIGLQAYAPARDRMFFLMLDLVKK